MTYITWLVIGAFMVLGGIINLPGYILWVFAPWLVVLLLMALVGMVAFVHTLIEEKGWLD